MYRLYMLGQDKWEIHTRKRAFEGSLKQVITYCVIELGMDIDEINAGILEMNKQGHNGIEFGVLKRFIFTFTNKNKEVANETYH